MKNDESVTTLLFSQEEKEAELLFWILPNKKFHGEDTMRKGFRSERKRRR